MTASSTIVQRIWNCGNSLRDDEGLVSRKFYSLPEGDAQQLSLLGSPPADDAEDAEADTVE